MKKTAIFFAASLALLATVTSCKQNTEPRFQQAPGGTFKLNTPALATQYYQLTEEGTIDLTWSQPDWGFAAAAIYTIEISLEQSFENFYEIPMEEYKTCSASVSEGKIAIGINTLNGVKKVKDYVDKPASPLYIRVVGSIPGVEDSRCVSNAICLTQVKAYCAIQEPGKIYLVGAPEGWKGPDAGQAEHYENWALYEAEDAIGSQIYHGTFQIPAGNAMFRFNTALTGWDADSWGSQADDNPVNVTFTNDEFSYTLVKGKGSFSFTDWTTDGTMDITVNMKTHELVIKASH